MKRLKITCIKENKFSLGKETAPIIMTEQIINTDQDKIDIPVPDGMKILTVIELLPEITLTNPLKLN